MPKVAYANVRIQLRKKKSIDKIGYLRLIYRFDGKELTYPLNTYLRELSKVKLTQWDAKARRAITSGKSANDNKELNKKLNTISDYVTTFHKENPKVTIIAFKEELDYYTGKKERPKNDGSLVLSLFDFIDQEITRLKKARKDKYKRYQILKNHLLTFQHQKKIELDYNSFDWKFHKEFKAYLFDTPNEYATNYAAKIFTYLKLILKESSKLDNHNNKIYLERDFGISSVKTNHKTVFSFDEIDIINELDLSNNKRLEKVRDIFILGCFTGLRTSDWKQVKKENITQNKNGSDILRIRTQKTNTEVYIPVLPQLQTILDKYDYNLPFISPQKFNEYLKEIIKLAIPNNTTKITHSIAEKLIEKTVPKYTVASSHVCRRSFATNFFQLGLDVSLLMQITGHATQVMFFKYVDADKKQMADQFAVKIKELEGQRYLKIAK